LWQGIVLVFNVTDRASFESLLPRHVAQVHKHAHAACKRVLVGSMCDRDAGGAGAGRVVSHEEALQFAHDNDMDYFETSAKDGIGIRECLFVLTRQVLQVGVSRVSEDVRVEGSCFIYPNL
jgi:GTPase SAR1 family protein